MRRTATPRLMQASAILNTGKEPIWIMSVTYPSISRSMRFASPPPTIKPKPACSERLLGVRHRHKRERDDDERRLQWTQSDAKDDAKVVCFLQPNGAAHNRNSVC